MIKYTFNQLKVPLNKREDVLKALARRISVPAKYIADLTILRMSLDARKGHRPSWVCNVEFSLEKQIREQKNLSIKNTDKPVPEAGIANTVPMADHVHVVGSGPAGLWAAYHLAKKGFKVSLYERGKPIQERFKGIRQLFKQRTLDPKGNVLYGEGGAGTFSDGKLTSRTRNTFTQTVLNDFVECGAVDEVKYLSKAHIGTDKLQFIVMNLREKLLELGVEYRFEAYVSDMKVTDGSVSQIKVNDDWIPCEALVMAAGHSARDVFEMLHDNGVAMEQKTFAVGTRAEHPQALINGNQYDAHIDIKAVGPAEYVLKSKPRGEFADVGVAYSFCMCPGGVLVPCATEPGELATNGMSYSRRSAPFANSGIIVQVEPKSDDLFWGVNFQRELEQRAFEVGGGDYTAPAQRIDDFIEGRVSKDLPKTSYPCGLKSFGMDELFPEELVKALQFGMQEFEHKIPGYIKNGIMVSPETRTSSPIRVLRHDLTMESVNIKGLFPLGEGAGYSGGIVSSAADGVRLAWMAQKEK
ncbi:MAG: NAD(P)-binding protein [Fibrobacterales bacterium]